MRALGKTNKFGLVKNPRTPCPPAGAGLPHLPDGGRPPGGRPHRQAGQEARPAGATYGHGH